MNPSPDSLGTINSAESEDLPLSFYWIEIFIILFSAALQTKAALLWSESRMLRKINNRKPEDLIQTVSATTFEEAFSKLYISLSKGRHSLLSRHVKTLYLLYGVALDNIFGAYSVDFYSSDAVTALIILVSLGSWTVLGVRRLTTLEILLLCFFAGLYCTSLVLFGSGTLATSDEIARVFFWLRLAAFCLIVVLGVWDYIKCNELPDIVAAMATDKLTKDREKWERFERMKEYMALEKLEDFTESCSLWPPSFLGCINIGAWVLVYASNAVVWGSYPQKLLPRVVVIEVFEFTSTVLLFVNDTQVEPTLFLRLIQLAQYKCKRRCFTRAGEEYDTSEVTPRGPDGFHYSSDSEDSF